MVYKSSLFFFVVLYSILLLYYNMVIKEDIITNRVYDSIIARYGRKTPILVVNNDFYNVDDPMLSIAKDVALHDILVDNTYIHPELIEGD